MIFSEGEVDCENYGLSGNCLLWKEGSLKNPSSCSLDGLCQEADDHSGMCSFLLEDIPYVCGGTLDDVSDSIDYGYSYDSYKSSRNSIDQEPWYNE